MTTTLLGIDCGGTNTKLLLTAGTDPGAVVRQLQFPTPRDHFLAEITHRLEGFLDGRRPDSFGVALPGILDYSTGVVVTSTNMPWLEGMAPATLLGGVLHVPGSIVHDGAATARAEVAIGAARGHADAFILALGTGVAGAHVVNGELRSGAHGAAGEIGHISQGGDRRCSCGQTGCLETYIGGTQLAARWREAGGTQDGRNPTAHDLVEAASRGDAQACAILDEATTALARGMLGLIALSDPGIIVVGGGIGSAIGQVVQPAADKVHALATFHQVPPIVGAELGVWGAAWGAILGAQDALAA